MNRVLAVILSTVCAIVGGLLVCTSFLFGCFVVFNPDEGTLSPRDWVMVLSHLCIAILLFVMAGTIAKRQEAGRREASVQCEDG